MKSAACHWGTCAFWKGLVGRGESPVLEELKVGQDEVQPGLQTALEPMVGSTIVCTEFGCGLSFNFLMIIIYLLIG